MKSLFSRLLACACLGAGLLHADERPYVNDQKVPESLEDLRLIQKLVHDNLDAARAATVCLKIGEGSGSGVVVSPEGLIMTAAHVSGGVEKDIKVLFEDGTEAEAVSLGLDSETDAALIKIVNSERKDWPHVEIDDKDSVQLGDWVFALGHSGGFDKPRGVVVRLGRIVKLSNSTLHSDCILIGGDSGGPLFDLHGKLVGIHSRVGQVLQENMHVPSDEFLRNWDQLMGGEFLGEGPFAQRPVKGNGYLGIATEAHEGGGIVITRMGEGSPAQEAGLQEGDVLLKANDAPLSKREDLQKLLGEMSAGEEITFELKRGEEEKTITFELGER
ncbi:MAG: trypsin-like peptidase domain-containing protein [Akkermansiaceae bacterium]|nr:trypsin-like peptidase domain-containing protein [Akkermansiaceae bacterium]